MRANKHWLSVESCKARGIEYRSIRQPIIDASDDSNVQNRHEMVVDGVLECDASEGCDLR